MPKIIFTATPELPRDIKHLGYKQGDVVMLSPDGCERWIRRGVAKYHVEPPAAPSLPLAETWVQPDGFDPETAAIDDVRAYLRAKDIGFHPNTGDARLREKAAEHFAAN